MRVRIFLALGVAALCGCQSNLSWQEPKNYQPPPVDTVVVNGFGLNDTVWVLPIGASPITVSHGVRNDGRGAAANYQAFDSVFRWIFRGSPTTGYGWTKAPSAAYVVPTAPANGPALAAGASGTITFPPFPVTPACGLFSETLILDPANALAETNEADNVDSTHHFFFIPGPQRFNIKKNEILTSIFHGGGAQVTTTWTITPAPGPGAATTTWVFAGFSFKAPEGSTLTVNPKPPARGGPAPMTITMTITPIKHISPSMTVEGKITVFSTDGCFLKQNAATVMVEHQLH